MPVSQQETLAWVDQELPGALALSERQGFGLDWNADELVCRVTLTQPKTGKFFYLLGEFRDYRELPPSWSFTDASFTQRGRQFMPKPQSPPPGVGSIFHNACCICAPFNRRAYKELSGPHGNWGGPAQWLQAAPGKAQARTLGEMLSTITRDLHYTEGHQ